MVVLDFVIVILNRFKNILVFEKPKGISDLLCKFKSSGFSVYGTDEKHIENVKVGKLCNYISSIKHQKLY